MRLSLVVGMLAMGCGASGVLYLALRDPVPVYVAARDLPAYHQIVETDIRRATIDSRGLPDDTTRDKAALLGRYTLKSVQQEDAIVQAELGPMLTVGRLDGLGLVALVASPETSVGGGIGRGDVVDVLLSRVDPSLVTQSRRLAGVLVVDVTSQSGQAALVLGLNAADQEAVQTALGTSRVIVVRVYPYQHP